jgi:Lrp/AsnC family transcriptional regulator for asnA, asnC and gidA
MQVQGESDGIRRNKNNLIRRDRDEFDRKLLDILYLDSRKKLQDIADMLNVSVTSVHNRIKSLEDRGIIKKFTIQIDSEKVGNDLTAIISLEIKVSHLHEVNQNLQTIPEIIALYNVTGNDDILAICRFRNRKHLNKVLQEILKIDHITKTKTQIALHILKEEYHTPKKAELSPELQDEVEKFNLLNNSSNKEIEVGK